MATSVASAPGGGIVDGFEREEAAGGAAQAARTVGGFELAATKADVAGATVAAGAEPDTAAQVFARRREVFWNLPNTLTLLRIAVVPVMLLLPFNDGVFMSRALAWCFIAAAVTDILDGWLARRGAQETRVGKLLDPLADKLLVSTTLIVLVAAGRIPPWATWMVVVILGRELAVTGLRGLASGEGVVVAASWRGKLKTLAQNVAAVALLFHYPMIGLPAHSIGLLLLAIATVLTMWSGYDYFARYFGWSQPSEADA